MTSDAPRIQTALDLSQCDREPIHIPGSVQSHGILLVLKAPHFEIIQVSDNTKAHLGAEPPELLGQGLESILGHAQVERLVTVALTEEITGRPYSLFDLQIGSKVFDGSVHRLAGLLILELEPRALSPEPERHRFQAELLHSLRSLHAATSVQGVCVKAAERVRAITGFDRVMVYRFLADDSGEVVAEAKKPDLQPFAGHRYPASDIPSQARELYRKSVIRILPDVNFQESRLLPENNPLTDAPLDMSFCILRSMSPVHREYLRNMGVTASMSISIVRDHRLWGLIACHHQTPKYVSHETRGLCEMLGQMLSFLLPAKEDLENAEYTASLQRVHQRLAEQVATGNDLQTALLRGDTNLLSAMNAEGAVLILGGEIATLGHHPPPTQLRSFLDWYDRNSAERLFSSHHLSSVYPGGDTIRDSASDVLAVRFSESRPDCLMWLRREQIETVNWAGDPNKPVEQVREERLTPRKSFELWKEEVRGTSVKWLPAEIKAASELGEAVVERMLKEEIAERNRVVLSLKRAEQGGAQQLAEIEAIYESSPIALGFVDTELRLIRVSEQMAAIGGFALEGSLGKPITALMPGVAAELETACRQVIDSGGAVLNVDIELPKAAGVERRRYFLASHYPLRKNDGALLGVNILFQEITERKRLIESEREREAARSLAAGILQGQEEERRRIARDLHDDLAQRLAVIRWKLGDLEEDARLPAVVKDGAIHKTKELCDDAHELVRRISHKLHPALLQHLGLKGALKAECRNYSEHEGITVRETYSDLPKDISQEVSLCLYRIAQEGLHNAAKYAGVTEVNLLLELRNGELRLEIQDRGAGFDPSKKNHGLGLTSMRERARQVHGELQVFSKPGEGTTLEAVIPVVPPHSVEEPPSGSARPE